jgi:6-phospho-3-hexuloisomerase
MLDYRSATQLILGELTTGLNAIKSDEVEKFVETLLDARRIFFIGVGRVMLSLQAIAKRLHHLGLETHLVGEITEPAITSRDALIVGSGSGESAVPLAIARIAKNQGARIVHIGSNPASSLQPVTDLFIRIPVATKLNLKGEIASKQIMSSLFEQSVLLLGDATALMIADRRNLNMKALWEYHANLE